MTRVLKSLGGYFRMIKALSDRRWCLQPHAANPCSPPPLTRPAAQRLV